MFQAFTARPGTAHVSAMFKPTSTVLEAARDVARTAVVAEDWTHQAVCDLLAAEGTGRSHVAVPHAHAFIPLLPYVLAIKCAARNVDAGETDDIRFVTRAMNLTSAESVLTVVGPYFTERQLPADTRGVLERLLGA